jgi:Lhr-like helicase
MERALRHRIAFSAIAGARGGPFFGDLMLAQLFDQDMLGDDLESWLAESVLMKRTFRQCAIIAGLVERRAPGEKKQQRQMTVSTDLVARFNQIGGT